MCVCILQHIRLKVYMVEIEYVTNMGMKICPFDFLNSLIAWACVCVSLHVCICECMCVCVPFSVVFCGIVVSLLTCPVHLDSFFSFFHSLSSYNFHLNSKHFNFQERFIYSTYFFLSFLNTRIWQQNKE